MFPKFPNFRVITSFTLVFFPHYFAVGQIDTLFCRLLKTQPQYPFYLLPYRFPDVFFSFFCTLNLISMMGPPWN